VLADQAIAARQRLFASKFAAQADLDALTTAAKELAAIIVSKRVEFERVRGAMGTSFMAHAIENMRADAAQRFEFAHAPKTTPERESRRDALNAANLRWLLEERYGGRKALVWAHDVHVMNACYDSDFRTVHLKQQPGDMKPTGVFLAEWLGRQVYTLGMTTFEGQDGFAMGGPATDIPPAPEGSLEARLHALGHSYSFVDFRALDGEPRHPMRASQSIRLPKYDSNMIADVNRIYDGIFYIDRMARATRAA
jgi:erythromycin esterase-like protein